jgi:actin-related protein
MSSGSEYIGDEAEKMRSTLDMFTPMEEGVIKDWDQMTKIWEYCFSEELRIDSGEHKILMSESPMTSNFNRERLTQHIFEKFNVKGFYLAP